MNRHILLTALMACILSSICPKAAFGDVSADEQNSNVKITITKLQINDQMLELSWKIINHSDHDVWICDDVSVFTKLDFEVYLSEDEQSLIIRRRLDVPTAWVWAQCPYGRYVLLRSGQERTESVSLSVPVESCCLFASGLATSDHARRLVLEIGFYNEDLPGTIRDILEMAEKLNCARLEYTECSTAFFIRYFKGIWMAHWLFGGFEEYTYKEGMEDMEIPYTWQKFNGEQVLRATIDGVSILYKSSYLPLTDEPTQSETEPADVTMALTRFDVNDTHLELSCKIRNNTDHDVWICNSLSQDPSVSVFEHFMDKDNKTLFIRRRFDLPIREGLLLERGGGRSRYVRLHPGQEKPELFSLSLPIRPYQICIAEFGNAECAERLILEISFYDEDLPGLILQIVELAEFLNCDLLVGLWENVELGERFFGGRQIAQYYCSNIGFGPSVRSADADGEMWMLYMGETRMGEKVLRLEIDGVSIPYKSNYPPLND